MNQEALLLSISILTLAVATIAAIYSYRADKRKAGVDIRGFYSLRLSIDAEDTYIGEVTLENMKDRTVVVFGIFLEIGHGDYLEIEQFADEPLLFQPFSVYRKEYASVDLYSANQMRVCLDSLLQPGKRPRKRLILSTAQGRYSVKKSLDRWDPGQDLLSNHRTGFFRPLRSTVSGERYGSRTEYLVQLTTHGGQEEAIPIYPWDYRFSKFQRFNLTQASLRSRDALETFLRARVETGELPCSDLRVLDLAKMRRAMYETQNKHRVEVTHQGWFAYYVVGRLTTRWRDFRSRSGHRPLNESPPDPRGPVAILIRPASGSQSAGDDQEDS